mgnify:CR=1 FL=1
MSTLLKTLRESSIFFSNSVILRIVSFNTLHFGLLKTIFYSLTII